MADSHSDEGMLSGTFVYTMDPKGRVIMPRRFRERLGVPFVLTKGIGGCLLAMSREKWQPLVERYSGESIIFQRFYLAGAVECRPSPRSGRFLIPYPLREFAEIKPAQEATVAGIGQAVEIWNKQRWERASKHPEQRDRRQLRFELDLEPAVSEPFSMRVRSLLGIPVVETRGAIDVRAARLLSARLQEVTPGPVPAVVLDLRQATRIRTAPAGLRWALSQRRAQGVAVCLLSNDASASRLFGRYADVFGTLEDALWWLEEHVPSRTLERLDPEQPALVGVPELSPEA